jgi:acyl-CoA dehydrogenase
MRDARIAPIYEGTNGIQAIDLVTRKLPLSGGEAAYARRARPLPRRGRRASRSAASMPKTSIGETAALKERVIESLAEAAKALVVAMWFCARSSPPSANGI